MGGRFQKFVPKTRLGRTLVGFTMIIMGIVGIVLPFLSFWLFPLGLALLAADYAWARFILKKTRDGLTFARRKVDRKHRV